MANNLLQFSVEVPLNADETKWFHDFLDDSDDLEDISSQSGGELGFEFEWIDNGILFYAEENGDPENLAETLLRFLTATTRYNKLGFTYSETCSSMRPGEFGGGAVLLKREKDGGITTEYMNAVTWLTEKMGW